ncbi:carboxypeptidase M32 [Cognatishimia sp. MH4019]|uniref:carboxypeptidase M32 n=1 Tax=Cognatishimia sp. MH4019 TaxID=2854030 RepID=UPI001CD6E9F8|nr:carboxypeptidase M32 [Cognatishimia sp. MH4019]
MTAYDTLMAFQRETEALGQIAGRLGWDQETMMPRGAAHQRGEEMAALEAVLHARRTDPQIGDWLGAIDTGKLDPVAAAQIREITRSFKRNAKVPAKLAAEIARVTSRSQGEWAEARKNEDFKAFVPTLERVVALRQEEGAALADGGDAYDALLQDYEPGTTAAELDQMFGALRPRLTALRAAILDKPAPAPVQGEFDEAAQLAISQQLALDFGYDLATGRIDKAVHPFSSGSGQDVRITTRTNPLDPFNCFYSTIHEVGHAAYEQGVDDAYALTPIGQGASMGVHESQSRIYENQLGRSRAFTGYLYNKMRDAFGDFGIKDEEAFYAAVNRIHAGYIRTEADEVQYNLHVLLRFDLERQLISGDLKIPDLEEAWNTRFRTDFGYAVDKPSNGCLQDVHWSVGLFGYFATYTLGNVYAGCLYESLRTAVPTLDADLARGDTSTATAWLRENLQQHGGLRTPRETIAHATGSAPSEDPLLSYLDAKFGALYQL